MHPSTSRRATEGSASRSRAVRRHRLAHDTAGSLASAVLPALLGTFGLVLISAGAFLALVPLVMAGAGLCVVGFAAYLIAEKVRRDEARARARAAEAKAARKKEAAAGFADWKEGGPAPLPPRSPLADAAVEALTGDGDRGGVWPPLGASDASAERGRPVTHWEPDGDVGPEAFTRGRAQEEEIRFEAVPPQTAAQGVHGGTTATAPRVHAAEPDAAPRDFRVWPGTKDMQGWERFSGSGGPRAGQVDPETVRARMKERRAKMAEGLPLVGAMLADEGDVEKRPAAFADKTRGKCSRCSSMIWAPKRRPIVLKCPSCGHKAKLY